MIRPTVSVQFSNTAVMDRLLKELPKLRKAYVTVGFHAGAGSYDDGTDVVEVALWNEFGTRPHMTAWGIVHSPERSFIRSSIDENTGRINKWRQEALVAIVERGEDPEKALGTLGYNVQVLIQNKIKSNVPPDNTDDTKAEKKRHDAKYQGHTLMDSGLMLESVTYKVFL